MGNSFLGLNTALSGLFANQRALGVVSHNLSNANTEGYSRQVQHMHAYRPDVLPGDRGSIGVGVEVESVKQIRDSYLDFKFRTEMTTYKEWEAKEAVLTNIESIFNEPTDASIAKVLDEFYSAMNDLSSNPENLTARALVRQNGIALSESIASISNALTKLQSDLNLQYKQNVDKINDYANKIADLNRSIYESEVGGGPANDLRDQRNLLVDKLNEVVDTDYYEDQEGRFFVTIGGHGLVSNYRTDKIELSKRTDRKNPSDNDNILDMQWEDGNKVTIKSGTLKGLNDMRDNIEGNHKGLPYYVDRLNDFADKFVEKMNTIHGGGYGLDSSTGVFMFTMDNMSTQEYKDYLMTQGLDKGPAVDVTDQVLKNVDPALSDKEKNKVIEDNKKALLAANPSYAHKTITLIDGKYMVTDKFDAKRMTVSKDLEDLNKIAASDTTAGLPGDGKNMLEMVNTRHDIEMYNWGSPEDFVKSLVSNLGVDKSAAKKSMATQKSLTDTLKMSRQSMMGVSFDEEVSRMIQYQAAYNACAKMSQTFNELLDTLINRLGA